MKNAFEKAKLSKEDPHLAMLQFRNTLIDGRSPAHVLMGRTQRTNVPVKQNSLKPRAISHRKFKEIRQEAQGIMKESFDKGTKKMQMLQSGETIRFQVEPSGRWRRGTVKQPQGIHSYVIETERGTYRRNRRHIRKTYEDSMPERSKPKDNCHEKNELKESNGENLRVNEEDNSADNVESGPVQDDGNQVQREQSKRTLCKTRSGRSVKPNREYTENFV